jgi:hypothetical protein
MGIRQPADHGNPAPSQPSVGGLFRSHDGPEPAYRHVERLAEQQRAQADVGDQDDHQALNVSPERLAIMMFGGSPMRVAVPPRFDAHATAKRYGAMGSPGPGRPGS